MSDNFYGKTHKSNKTYSNSNVSKNFFEELLQELHMIVLKTKVGKEYFDYNIKSRENFINNLLLDYDLDPKNVFEFMTKSSQNIVRYSSLIGFFYQHGIGCEVDKIKAFEIFSNAISNNQKVELNYSFSDQKNEVSFYNNIKKLNTIILQHSYCLLLYKDVILYREDNYKLYMTNAGKGDPVSQNYVGDCYYYGRNIQTNHTKAFEWYSKSSEGGNIKAAYNLGRCYQNGHGTTKNEKKAFGLYLKSAEGGYIVALYVVGNCYHDGSGTLKDRSKAFKWYLHAAKKGHDHSQYLVAKYYNDGMYIPINALKAFYWNRKAAINGNIEAQFKLVNYYINDPINKDEKKAFKWCLKMASLGKFGMEYAIYLVAKCYRDGIGTDKNLVESKKWFKEYESVKCIF